MSKQRTPFVPATAIFVLVLIIGLLVWFLTDGFDLGGAKRQLVNTTAQATAGNFDSLDFPRSTAYTVPAGRTFRVDVVHMAAATSTVALVEVGYGDNRVTDSVAAPTNPVVLFVQSIGAGVDAQAIQVRLEVPASKVPYIRFDNGSPWELTVEGVER